MKKLGVYPINTPALSHLKNPNYWEIHSWPLLESNLAETESFILEYFKLREEDLSPSMQPLTA